MDHKCKKCTPRFCTDPFCTKGMTEAQIKEKERLTRFSLGAPTEYEQKEDERNEIESRPTWSR